MTNFHRSQKLRTCFFLLTGANLLSTFAADVEKDFCGGICLRIKKKSGAFSAVRCGKGKKKDFGAPKYDKAFELKMESIEQQDKDGKKVGQRVDKDSIDKQDFDFTQVNRTAKYHGLKAVHVGLKGHLKGPQAFLHVDAYVFCEAGSITFGNETFEVQNGTLKLFFKVCCYCCLLLHTGKTTERLFYFIYLYILVKVIVCENKRI